MLKLRTKLNKKQKDFVNENKTIINKGLHDIPQELKHNSYLNRGNVDDTDKIAGTMTKNSQIYTSFIINPKKSRLENQNYQQEYLKQNMQEFHEFTNLTLLKTNLCSDSNKELSKDDKMVLDLVQSPDYWFQNYTSRRRNIEYVNRVKRSDTDEEGPTPAKKTKQEGIERGGPGLDYQVQLLMLFARQGYEFSKDEKRQDYSFEIGKERKEADKFDDIVFRYKDKKDEKEWKYLLLQAKHTTKEKKIITTGMLLSSDNTEPFTLIKYFSSYVNSKKIYEKAIGKDKGTVENCVIITNNDFAYENGNKLKPTKARKGNTGGRANNFYIEEAVNVNDIFKIQKAEQAKYYKLSKEIIRELKEEFKEQFKDTAKQNPQKGIDKEIIENLGGIIVDDSKLETEIVDFLEKLLFIVNLPDREGIRIIIKEKIGAEFLLLNDGIVDQFNRDMFDYTIKPGQGFRSGSQIERFFHKMKVAINTLSTKPNYYLKIQDSKIDFKEEIKKKFDCKSFLLNTASNNQQILLLRTKSMFLTAVKMYRVLQKIKSEDKLEHYTYDDRHTFLSLTELLDIKTLKQIVLKSFDEEGFNLLVIVFDASNYQKEQDLQKELSAILSTKKNKRIIFIAKENHKLKLPNFKQYKDKDNKFSDLTDDSKRDLLDNTVTFQGENISLKQLYFKKDEKLSADELDKLNEFITVETLENLEEDSIEIKKPLSLSDLESAYSKFYEEIKENVLKKNLLSTEEIFFVISGLNKPDELLQKIKSIDQKQGTTNIKKITVENDRFNEDDFKEFCHTKPDEKIYWVHWKKDEFILRSFYNPKFYLSRGFKYSNDKQNILLDSEKELIEKIKEKSALIVDDPGMGKSTTLVHLSQKMLASHWVIHISLKDCQQAIQYLLDNPDIIIFDKVINFLSRTNKLSIPLEKDLVKYKLDHEYKDGRKPLLLLFDGFDEIKSNSGENREKKAISALLKSLKEETQATVWVTARKNDAKILQESLSICTIEFKKFEDSRQKEYFENTWKDSLRLSFDKTILKEDFESKFSIYYKELSEQMTKVLNEENSSFMGIPLTLRLFVEIFRDKFKRFIAQNSGDTELQNDFDDLSVLTLYSDFIDKKFEIFFKEKTNLFDEFSQISQKWFKELVIEKHQRLAFLELFGSTLTIDLLGENPPFSLGKDPLEPNKQELEELFRFGLIKSIQDNHFEFIHRTFAEYFVAKTFAHMLTSKKENHQTKNEKVYDFLEKKSSSTDNDVISKFLDALAEKDETSEWNYEWWTIRNIKKKNLLGEATGEKNELRLYTQYQSTESLQQLKQKVEDLIVWPEDNCAYMKDGWRIAIYQLFVKFMTETNIVKLKDISNLWLKMYFALVTKLLEPYDAIDETLWGVLRRYRTEAQKKNQFDSEFIKNWLEKFNYKENIVSKQVLEENNIVNDSKELVEQINELYREANFEWLEIKGIKIVKSLKMLTPDMSKAFNNVIKDYGSHTEYAKKIWDELIKHILNLILCYEIDNEELSKINKSEFLNIFQAFSKLRSGNDIERDLCEYQLKSLLECITNVMQPENISQMNLFYGIESLRELRKWNLHLGENFVLKLKDKDYKLILPLQHKGKIAKLLIFRLNNPDDEVFQTECKKVAESIKNSHTADPVKAQSDSNLEGYGEEHDFLNKAGCSSASGSHVRKKRAIWSCTEQEEETGKQRVVKTGKWHEVVQWLIKEKRADINHRDEFGRTILHKAAGKGNLQAVKFLLEQGASIDIKDKYGTSLLHFAVASNNLPLVKWLISEQQLPINVQDQFGKSPLHFAALYGYGDMVSFLRINGADVNLQDGRGATALDLAIKEQYLEVITKLQQQDIESDSDRNNQQSLELQSLELEIDSLKHLRQQQEQIGLKAVMDLSSDCIIGYRIKRHIGSCQEEDEVNLFPYQPLEESVTDISSSAARLYHQVAMSVMLQYPDKFGDGQSVNNIINYNRYIGDIIAEQSINHSPREQQILAEHYTQAQQFSIDYPKTKLLKKITKGSKGIANIEHQSWLFDNDHYSILIFRDGTNYNLYSQDFNYRQRFQTKKEISFDQLEGFVEAFFKWRSGSSDYQLFSLADNLPENLIDQLKQARLWSADQVAPDSVILSKDFDIIESIPISAIRELFLVDGKVPDISFFHSDFFHQANISFRIELLHKALTSLNLEQIQSLVSIINKYNLAMDRTYIDKLSEDEQLLLEIYYNKVEEQLKSKPVISEQILSELSWESLNAGIAGHPDISDELAHEIVSRTKEIHSSSSKGAMLKGMATQTMFFLPDIIRAFNSGDISNLEQTGAMIAGDTTVNHLYSALLSKLGMVLAPSRVELLSKLPVTSPIFKAVTIYSIVELHEQLASLPVESPERNIIKHKLGEQYLTAGLMVAELLGFEVTPLWIALVAEQLIFGAESFSKENRLDIPFWEALAMSLGFEQDKLQHILEERQLVEMNLALVNQINSQAQIPYSLTIVKIAKLGKQQWRDINQDQIPDDIRRTINNMPEAFMAKVNSPQKRILENDSFRQVNNYDTFTNYFAMDGSVPRYRDKLISSVWQKSTYNVHPAEANIKFALYNNHYKSSEEKDNIFLDQGLGNNSNWQRIPVKYQGIKSIAGAMFLSQEIERQNSILDPVARNNTGLAVVYRNNQTDSNNLVKNNFYVFFDPREGDLDLQFTKQGLKKIDEINKVIVNGASYMLTVQVGYKAYPSSLEFSNEKGEFSLRDESQRIISQYMISDNVKYRINDDTSASRLIFNGNLPEEQQQLNYSCNTITGVSHSIVVKNWLCNSKVTNGINKVDYLQMIDSGFIAFGQDKKYLQLNLYNHVIENRHLTISAEHTEIIEAKGQSSLAMINLREQVTSFNISLRGDIIINDGAVYLQLKGVIATELPAVNYAKGARNKLLSFYQLNLEDLQPVLATLTRLDNTQVDIRFTSNHLEYHWQNKAPQNNSLQIAGTLSGKIAFLQIENSKDSIKTFLSANQVDYLEIIHHDAKAILEAGVVLTKIFKSNVVTNDYSLVQNIANIDSLKMYNSNKFYDHGGVLVFKDARHLIYHCFPMSDKITLNDIDYLVTEQRICAVAENQEFLNANQLIRYSSTTSNSGNVAKMIGICFTKPFSASKIVMQDDSLIINGLTVKYLDDDTKLYFPEQEIFEVKALKDSYITSATKKGRESNIIDQQLAKIDSKVVNGIKYLITVINNNKQSVTDHCVGFKMLTEQQEFLDANLREYNPAILKQIVEDSKAVEGLIWLIVKDYYDQSLLKPNKSHQELVQEIGQCYKLVLSTKVIHRLLKHLPSDTLNTSDNVTIRVENFIKHHHEALKKKIIDAISLTRGETSTSSEKQEEGTKNLRRVSRSVDDDLINSSASSINSPITNIIQVISNIGDWCQDKTITILSWVNKQQGSNNEQLDNDLPAKSTFDSVDYSVFNLNSSLTLLDVIVRKFTKVKPYHAQEETVNYVETLGEAMNITDSFEQLLRQMSEEGKIFMKVSAINYPSLMGELRAAIVKDSSDADICQILYKSIEGSQIDQDIKLKGYIEKQILAMLEKPKDILLAKESLMDDDTKDNQLEAKNIGFSNIAVIENYDDVTPELSSRCCELISCST